MLIPILQLPNLQAIDIAQTREQLTTVPALLDRCRG